MSAIELEALAEHELVAAPQLSVVLPVYNASRKIHNTLGNLNSRLSDLASAIFELGNPQEYEQVSVGRPYETGSRYANWSSLESRRQPWYEIIVVNDGSTDDTEEILGEIARKDSRLRMISYRDNMGKGYAIKQGVLRSRGKYVIFMDGDGEINTDLSAAYLQNLRNADMIIASKYHPSSIVTVPRMRKFLSRCFNMFVKAVIPLRVSDTQVGFKAGRGDAFRKIFRCVLVKRYAFDVEMLALATLLGLKIVEMPVEIHLDARFRKKEIVRMALDVLGIAYRLRIVKWYQKNIYASELVKISKIA